MKAFIKTIIFMLAVLCIHATAQKKISIKSNKRPIALEQQKVNTNKPRQSAKLSAASAHQKIKTLYLNKLRAQKLAAKNDYSGYYLCDITSNGIPDLWIYTSDNDEIWRDLRIYTFSNGSLKEIFNQGGSYLSVHIGNNYFISNYSTPLEQVEKFSYRKGKMKKVVLYDGFKDRDDNHYIGNSEVSEPEIEFIPFSNERPILNMFK